MRIERRTSIRLKRKLAVEYSRGGHTIAPAQALDISEHGARLLLEQASSSPNRLTLRFEGKLTLLAETIWSERLPDGRWLVGVRFQGLHLGQQVSLSLYLNELITRAAA